MTHEKNRPGFVIFHTEMRRALRWLTKEQIGYLIEALYNYSCEGNPGMFADERVAEYFEQFKDGIDRGASHYEESRRQGAIGGRYGQYRSRELKAGREPLAKEEWLRREEAAEDPEGEAPAQEAVTAALPVNAAEAQDASDPVPAEAPEGEAPAREAVIAALPVNAAEAQDASDPVPAEPVPQGASRGVKAPQPSQSQSQTQTQTQTQSQAAAVGRGRAHAGESRQSRGSSSSKEERYVLTNIPEMTQRRQEELRSDHDQTQTQAAAGSGGAHAGESRQSRGSSSSKGERYVLTYLPQMTRCQQEELRGYHDRLGAEADALLMDAVDEAAAGGSLRWRYLRRVLDGMLEAGVTTVAEARERRARHAAGRSPAQPAKPVPAQQYHQRDYSGADEALPDWVMQRWHEMYGGGQSAG